MHAFINQPRLCRGSEGHFIYCKSGNFRENFNFANSVKRHSFDWKISRLGYDSPISVVERVISSFCEDFISRNFAYAKFRENKTLAKISEFTVNMTGANAGVKVPSFQKVAFFLQYEIFNSVVVHLYCRLF